MSEKSIDKSTETPPKRDSERKKKKAMKDPTLVEIPKPKGEDRQNPRADATKDEMKC